MWNQLTLISIREFFFLSVKYLRGADRNKVFFDVLKSKLLNVYYFRCFRFHYYCVDSGLTFGVTIVMTSLLSTRKLTLKHAQAENFSITAWNCCLGIGASFWLWSCTTPSLHGKRKTFLPMRNDFYKEMQFTYRQQHVHSSKNVFTSISFKKINWYFWLKHVFMMYL